MVYEVELSDGEVIEIENPSKMPDPAEIAEIREPIVTVHLYMPQEYVGPGDDAVPTRSAACR